MRVLASSAILVLLLSLSPSARAWQIHGPIHHDCHERISHAALRSVGYVTPPPPLGGDDASLRENLEIPADRYDANLYALSLVLGARWDDTQGGPDFALYEQAVAANAADDQPAHCLRSEHDDGPGGDARAVATCRAAIEAKIARALASLDATGAVNPDVRTYARIHTAYQGTIEYPLSEVYFWTGRALHTLQDGFTHTFRSPDGRRVRHVFNWVEQVKCDLDEAKDGHGHETFFDDCEDGDPSMNARIALTGRASAELIALVTTPGSRVERDARLRTFLDAWVSYEPGCTLANGYCGDPSYAFIRSSDRSDADICDGFLGCDATARPRHVAFALALLVAMALAVIVRRKRLVVPLALLLAAWPSDARADSEGRGPHVEARASLSVDEPAYAFGAAGLWGFGRAEVGAFAELNPWYSIERHKMSLGSTNFGVLGHYLHPLRSDLRLRFGAGFGFSMLNMDLVGADAGTVGLYANFRLMGLVWQLAQDAALTIDPIDIALPAPVLTGWPALYFQQRLSVGFQYWF